MQVTLDRICVAGGPKVGKTTYAERVADQTRVRHTDSVIGSFGNERQAWSLESEAVSHWFDEPGPWLIEGTTVPRALRKWLERNPTGKPCEVLVWLEKPRVERTKGQESMAKAIATVLGQILPELQTRGVSVVKGDAPGGAA